jgi:hypothetical protein
MDSNSILTFGVRRCATGLRDACPCWSVLFCGVEEIYCLSEEDLETLCNVGRQTSNRSGGPIFEKY